MGISRRLNTQSARQLLPATPDEEISFWYLANRLGRTFLRDAANRLGRLEQVGSGIWRSGVLGQPCFLVSVG